MTKKCKTNAIDLGSISISVRANDKKYHLSQRRFLSIRSPWRRVGGYLARMERNRRYDTLTGKMFHSSQKWRIHRLEKD